MLISSSFVGCLDGIMGDEDIEDIEDEGPRLALLTLFADIESGSTKKWCEMYPPHAYSLENDVITFSDETTIKACEEEMSKLFNLEFWRFAEEQGILRYTLNSYKDVKIEGKVATNSGPTYEVTTEMEICVKLGGSSSWDCVVYSIEDGNELVFYFTEVVGQWIDQCCEIADYVIGSNGVDKYAPSDFDDL